MLPQLSSRQQTLDKVKKNLIEQNGGEKAIEIIAQMPYTPASGAMPVFATCSIIAYRERNNEHTHEIKWVKTNNMKYQSITLDELKNLEVSNQDKANYVALFNQLGLNINPSSSSKLKMK
jgi:hypothetical protein